MGILDTLMGRKLEDASVNDKSASLPLDAPAIGANFGARRFIVDFDGTVYGMGEHGEFKIPGMKGVFFVEDES